jgi:hypothetical protein
MCSLGVLAASIVAVFAGYDRVPGMTSGEGVLLAIATFPFAVLSTVLSVRGRTSTTRRGLAITGVLFCLVYYVLMVLGAVVLYMGWSACASQVDGCI